MMAPIPSDLRAWLESLWEAVLPSTTGQSYQNFPDPELSDWATAYYGDFEPDHPEGWKNGFRAAISPCWIAMWTTSCGPHTSPAAKMCRILVCCVATVAMRSACGATSPVNI